MNKKTNQIFAEIYLFYIALVPVPAVFVLQVLYGFSHLFLLFIAGTAGLGVYLAAVYYYTPVPDRLWKILILFSDGPIFALIAGGETGSFLFNAVDTFIIEGFAVWASILVLALVSPRPTRMQRFFSVFFMSFVLVITGLMVFPYIITAGKADPLNLIMLAAGTVEGLIARFILFKRDVPVRRPGENILPFVFVIILWLVAFVSGNLLYEAKIFTQFS